VPFPHITLSLFSFAYLLDWLDTPANTFQHLITFFYASCLSTPSSLLQCTLADRTEHLLLVIANALQFRSSAMPPNPIVYTLQNIFACALFFQSALTPDIPPFL
jgi:hypothetical protein